MSHKFRSLLLKTTVTITRMCHPLGIKSPISGAIRLPQPKKLKKLTAKTISSAMAMISKAKSTPRSAIQMAQKTNNRSSPNRRTRTVSPPPTSSSSSSPPWSAPSQSSTLLTSSGPKCSSVNMKVRDLILSLSRNPPKRTGAASTSFHS